MAASQHSSNAWRRRKIIIFRQGKFFERTVDPMDISLL
jgi:hypothetical protein